MEMAVALALLLEDPARTALFCDYDGTLAPIVDDPEAALPLPGISDVLRSVARRFGLVAVVSGRPLAWLRRQLGDPDGVDYAGQYGLERMHKGTVTEVPDAARWRQAIENAAEAAEAELPPAVLVERKSLSLTLHARTAPEHDETIQRWAEARAARDGLSVHQARRSVELRPPVALDKGTVVAELGRGYDVVCFVGDDRGDLAAFDALSRLADGGARTVAVAVASDESPDELLRAADLVLDGPARVFDLLRRLA
jgi:trehalose 6-phosphate phosphatase